MNVLYLQTLAMYEEKDALLLVNLSCCINILWLHKMWLLLLGLISLSLSLFLLEPQFISAYEIGNFTFFFLRENAVEHDCGKTVYSRVARVCKNDIGGRFLLEDTWTTFTKARLNCSRSGEIPFYYNELQSTFFLPEQDLIYGIFTTNVWVHSTAVSKILPCFRMALSTPEYNRAVMCWNLVPKMVKGVY